MNIRSTECPKTLKLLLTELALQQHTDQSLVTVYESGVSIDSEEKYSRVTKQPGSILVVEARTGEVDHFSEVRNKLKEGKLPLELIPIYESVFEGTQKEIRNLSLQNVPSLSVDSTILPILPLLTRLEVLKLSSPIFNSVSIPMLMKHLPDSLQFLSIENMRLDQDSLSALAERLETLKLTNLLLKTNTLEPRGLQILRPGLIQQDRMTYLMIENNELSTEGCFRLISLLPHFSSLQFLELRNNEFPSSALNHLIRALSMVPTLKHLALDGNDLSSEATLTVQKFLPQFDFSDHGYYLSRYRNEDKPEVGETLKWGRMRNFVILRERIRRKARF